MRLVGRHGDPGNPAVGGGAIVETGGPQPHTVGQKRARGGFPRGCPAMILRADLPGGPGGRAGPITRPTWARYYKTRAA